MNISDIHKQLREEFPATARPDIDSSDRVIGRYFGQQEVIERIGEVLKKLGKTPKPPSNEEEAGVPSDFYDTLTY